ncbi:MAG TPA: 4'-phosphopantetheinyl transferase superfamily protein [Candidatus Blautia excrementipullorum]|nr:4'-phosphopantetheinyl transferase superfamily protein [Candidatus Blautia excrementipullorum]
MNAVIYYTEISAEYENKKMEHMIGEKLLEEGLKKEYGLNLKFEPRARGEHGKPFFTLQPKIHYNISHSGKYVVCIFAGEEVGIDIQEHKKVNYEHLLRRMVPPSMMGEILEAGEPDKAFYTQWVLREAYIKWTGEGLSRDLRSIPMDSGSWLLLDLEPGYSGAVWSADPLELRWEHAEVKLP